ncbi:hypothetical protein HIM_00308 [Hirsutella minnesotensis 3608]|nr:hypothetical protein HIM_00308 [Hirsutella minnesotensis 3608]
MSAQAPQVLSRRTNGAPPSAAGQQNDPSIKGKSKQDSHTQRRSRSRLSGDKAGNGAKAAQSGEPAKRSRTKTQSEGEKLVIRRLPPALTQAEFVAILGVEWELNKGKVDWLSYCPGKVTADPAKPSRPSRAYLHVMRKDDIMSLSQTVRAATWEDAKSTFTDPALVGPPGLEFSAYKKIPSNRRRIDPRQGTIDQDQEFMAFLEGLANPVPLKECVDIEETDEAAKEDGKITTTPLVEYLKEKKANKGKDSGIGKNSKSATAKGKGATKEEDKKKGKEPKVDKSEKPAKEPVKILTKKAPAEPPSEASRNPPSQAPNANTSDAPKSRRAGIAAAARILQRDLGLSPGSAHRRARHDAAKADGDGKTTSKEALAPASEASNSPAEATATQQPKARSNSPAATRSQPASRRARGAKAADKGKTVESPATAPAATNPPVVLKKSGDDEAQQAGPNARSTPKSAPNGRSTSTLSTNTTKSNSNKVTSSQRKGSVVTAGAVRAFVKHASTSQGATEAAIRQAFEAFGPITRIEVDKRKGFAYIDFAEHDGLVKAVSASPVQVAQATVQVLERKEKKPAASATVTTSGTTASSSMPSEKGAGRGRRGRGGGGGGGNKANGTANGPAPVAATSTGGTG